MADNQEESKSNDDKNLKELLSRFDKLNDRVLRLEDENVQLQSFAKDQESKIKTLETENQRLSESNEKLAKIASSNGVKKLSDQEFFQQNILEIAKTCLEYGWADGGKKLHMMRPDDRWNLLNPDIRKSAIEITRQRIEK